MVAVTACLYMNPVSDKIAKMVLFKKMDTHTFPVITEDFAPYAQKKWWTSVLRHTLPCWVMYFNP